MVRIRLRRVGAKKQPYYRIVVTEASFPRNGRFIETIGHYDPRAEPPAVEINAERALYWLSVGAQPSDAVKRMLGKMGILSQITALRRGELSIEEALARLAPTAATAPVVKPQREMKKLVAEVEPVVAEEEEPEELELIEAEEEEPEELEPIEAEAEELADELEPIETEEEESAEESEATEAED